MGDGKDPKTDRRPAYRLSVKSRQPDGGYGVIGAGWAREDGSISIKLNPCVVLSHSDDVMIFLFPTDEDYWKRKKRMDKSRSAEKGGAAVIGPGNLLDDEDGEEMPF